MRAMNGLTHDELVSLKQQLAKAESDVRQLLQEDFNRRSMAEGGEGAYRESVDDEAIAYATNDPVFPLVSACSATRDAIEKSLNAMQAGIYGACEECGRPIGLKKLRSQPTATRCDHCEAEQARSPSPPQKRA